MPPPRESLITFSFDFGEIQLTSVIDPETKQHLVTCDLCSQVIKLGIKRSITPISLHRDSEKCKRKAFKESKINSRNQNLVSKLIQIMLCSPKNLPCTNVPIYCTLCLTAVSGDPPTILEI